jgi:hypothetical protein
LHKEIVELSEETGYLKTVVILSKSKFNDLAAFIEKPQTLPEDLLKSLQNPASTNRVGVSKINFIINQLSEFAGFSKAALKRQISEMNETDE